jgi:MFS family permease
VIAGVASWWMVFDWPDTARFLTPDERLRVQRRLAADGQTHTSEQYDKRHIKAALSDWKTYAFAVVWMGNLCPLYSFSLFLPTIIEGLGYAGTTAQLMTVPPYICAALLTILVGYLADRWRMRGLFNIGCVSVAAIGFIMLISTPNHNVQYAGTFLAAAGIYPTIPNSLSWAANNFEGVYKRGVVLGTIVGWGNLNGVVSSNIYLKEESPRFYTGHAVVLSWQVCFLLGGSIFIYFMLGRENKLRQEGKRDHWLEGKSSEDVRFMGDKRPGFIYTR